MVQLSQLYVIDYTSIQNRNVFLKKKNTFSIKKKKVGLK